ncbi:Cytochrome P450 4C1, partial [Gryllus bimaculatus]
TSNDKMILTVMQGLALLVLTVLLPYYLMFISGKARLVSSLPGPTPLPFIGNALEIGRNGVELLSMLSALRQQYGSFVRLWLGPYLVVAVADPQHAETFLTSKTNITKSLQYKFIEVMAGKGLLTSTGDKWRSDRKLINPAFSYKILEEFLTVFNSQASVLTQKLKKEVGGPEFDIHKYLLLCALDISCESSMGVKMNIQDDKNNEYLRALSSVETCIVKRCMRPWLYPDFIFNFTELGKQLKTSLKIVRETANKIIQKRKREFSLKEDDSAKNKHENEFGYKKKTPFLDLLLQHERDGYFTDQDIQDQGHDTVATSSGFCLWLLANHPQCQHLLLYLKVLIHSSPQHKY